MYTDEEKMLAHLGKIVLIEFPKIYQYILSQVHGLTSYTCKRIIENKDLKVKLSTDEKLIVDEIRKKEYSEFTFRLCYIFYRHFGWIDPPKQQWGKVPDECDIGLADDIERIRCVANEISAAATWGIAEVTYCTLLEKIKVIFERTETHFDVSLKFSSAIGFKEDIKEDEIEKVLEFLQKYESIPDDTCPTNQVSQGRSRYARLGLVIAEKIPELMREIVCKSIPALTLHRLIHKALKKDPGKFDKFVTHDERLCLSTLKQNTYHELDFATIYKLIRAFDLLEEPTQGWAKQPMTSDTKIADDIERLRIMRNSIVHKIKPNISQSIFDQYFLEFASVARRVDKYLKKKVGTGFENEIESCMTCSMDYEMELKYQQALQKIEDIQKQFTEGCFNIYYGKTFEHYIQNKKKELPKNEKIKIYMVLEDVEEADEKTRLLNNFKKELNEGKVLVEFETAKTGSLFLLVSVLDTLISSDTFDSEISIFIKDILEFISKDKSIETDIDVVLFQEDDCCDLDIIVEDNELDMCMAEIHIDQKSMCMEVNVKPELFQSEHLLQTELARFVKRTSDTNGAGKLACVSVLLASHVNNETTPTDKSGEIVDIKKGNKQSNDNECSDKLEYTERGNTKTIDNTAADEQEFTEQTNIATTESEQMAEDATFKERNQSTIEENESAKDEYIEKRNKEMVNEDVSDVHEDAETRRQFADDDESLQNEREGTYIRVDFGKSTVSHQENTSDSGDVNPENADVGYELDPEFLQRTPSHITIRQLTDRKRSNTFPRVKREDVGSERKSAHSVFQTQMSSPAAPRVRFALDYEPETNTILEETNTNTKLEERGMESDYKPRGQNTEKSANEENTPFTTASSQEDKEALVDVVDGGALSDEFNCEQKGCSVSEEFVTMEHKDVERPQDLGIRAYNSQEEDDQSGYKLPQEFLQRSPSHITVKNITTCKHYNTYPNLQKEFNIAKERNKLVKTQMSSPSCQNVQDPDQLVQELNDGTENHSKLPCESQYKNEGETNIEDFPDHGRYLESKQEVNIKIECKDDSMLSESSVCMECVKAIKVTKYEEIRIGDHIIFSGRIYDHHAIVVKKHVSAHDKKDEVAVKNPESEHDRKGEVVVKQPEPEQDRTDEFVVEKPESAHDRKDEVVVKQQPEPEHDRTDEVVVEKPDSEHDRKDKVVVEKPVSVHDKKNEIVVEMVHATNTPAKATLASLHPFGSKARLRRVQESVDLTSRKVMVVKYSSDVKPFSRGDIVKRAIAEADADLAGGQGQFKYNLFQNNCEHFATWCVTGRKLSLQVRKFSMVFWMFLKSGFYDISDEFIRNEKEYESGMLCENCYSRNKKLLLNIQKEKISKASDVNSGDIIIYSYYFLWHCAVVLNVLKRRHNYVKCEVAHYAYMGMFRHRKIITEQLLIPLDGTVMVAIYPDDRFNVYSPDEVVKRARSRVDEQLFAFFTNDSSQFSRWCKLKLELKNINRHSDSFVEMK